MPGNAPAAVDFARCVAVWRENTVYFCAATDSNDLRMLDKNQRVRNLASNALPLHLLHPCVHLSVCAVSGAQQCYRQ